MSSRDYVEHPSDIEPIEPNVGEAFTVSRVLVSEFVPRPTTGAGGLIAIAVLACGAMIAKAIYQVDATLRRRLP